MSKITLANVTNLQTSSNVITINNNSGILQTAMDNTLSRDGTSPNQMGANLDMNSNRIINLPAAVGSSDPVRLAEFNQAVFSGISLKVNTQTGTSYTFQVSDSGGLVSFNNSSAVTATLPSGLGAAFSCMIVQLGLGQVGVTAGSGATLNSLSGLTHLNSQYAMGTIIAPAANTFVLGGELG